MNIAPLFGSGPNAAIWLFANAAPNVEAIPITSPVDFISGPNTVSTPCPSMRRKRFHGKTASFTDIPFALPLPVFGSIPMSFNSAMVLPAAINAAALAT